MAVRPFLTLISGVETLVNAIIASTGVADANKVVATNASGKIDLTLLPAGLDISVVQIEAGEILVAGDYINIYDDAAVLKVRKADGALAREAHGFVLQGYAAAATADVYLKGLNDQYTGQTFGGRVWLSTSTAGLGTQTAPANTDGHIIQVLGYASNATTHNFEYNQPITVNFTL